MELVPRISRAQKMDALSSQSNLAGYKAVLLAADHLPKIFPLLMTAAGTINPAKVVVMGAGVAGLQAIATAKRLGAVVEVSDVRPAVKEQVESLGARYIEPPATLQSTPSDSLEDKGGYAKAASAEFLKQQQAITHKHIIVADVVICTALVPGKTAPKLISKETVEAMRPGSVIVDMAVEQGGNCELSQLGKIIRHHDVTIIGLTNLPGMLPTNASEVYSKNILAVVQHLYADQKLNLDLADEINHAAIVTHGSQVLWKPS
jgi:NAD(P) transhydrogenase subunit alpha